jgi:hypothetical protein
MNSLAINISHTLNAQNVQHCNYTSKDKFNRTCGPLLDLNNIHIQDKTYEVKPISTFSYNNFFPITIRMFYNI